MQISKSLLEKIVLEELHSVLSELEGTAAPEETSTRRWLKSLLPDSMSAETKEWAATGLEVADFTGITGWEEAYDSWVKMSDDPSWVNLGWAALSSAAAIPIIGKIGKAGAVAKLANQSTEAVRILRAAGEPAAARLASRIENVVASANAALPAAGRVVDPKVAKRFGKDISDAVDELSGVAPGTEALQSSLKGIARTVTRPGFKGFRRLGARVLGQGGKSGAEFAGADVPWAHSTPDVGGGFLGDFDLSDLGLGGTAGDEEIQPDLAYTPPGPGVSPAPSALQRPVPDVTLPAPGMLQPGRPLPSPAPGPPVPRRPVCNNQDILHDAYEMYDALKGWGTDEETVYRIIRKNSMPECMATLYRAYEEVLRREDDTDDGDLIDWLRDDGEDASAMKVKKGMISWSGSIRSKKTKKRKKK